MVHDGFMLAIDRHSRRVVVFYGEIDKADPQLLGWVDTFRCQHIVVDLKVGGLDVSLESHAIKAPRSPIHQFFGVVSIIAVFRPRVDDGPYPLEYLSILVLFYDSGHHDCVVERASRRQPLRRPGQFTLRSTVQESCRLPEHRNLQPSL
jgi:hypothetical protein